MTKLVSLQTKISEECKKILRQQKSKQQQNIGKIIEDLVIKEYSNKE